jgi:hypothetical protein
MTQRRWLAKKCFQCTNTVEEKDAIIIDEEQDKIFCSENCLYQHFSKQIEHMEKEFLDQRTPSDLARGDFTRFEGCLEELLEGPDEIWEDLETFEDIPLFHYIGQFVVEEQPVYYVATVHMTGENPTFVFLHFPTIDSKLVEYFRRGRLIYDKSQAEIEIDGAEEDALKASLRPCSRSVRGMTSLKASSVAFFPIVRRRSKKPMKSGEAQT